MIIVWLIGAVILTLSPFNIWPKNGVTSTPEGGLHFESPSVAYLRQVPPKLRTLHNFSIVMEMKSEMTSINFDGIIFGSCIDYDDQNFLMVQVQKNASFSMYVDGATYDLFAKRIFENDSSVWIEIIYDGDKLSFVKNGSVQNVLNTGKLDFSRWNNSYPFVFANRGDGMNPWSGSIYSYDFFDSVVTISTRQELERTKRRLSPLISLPNRADRIQLEDQQKGSSVPSIVIPEKFNPPGKGLIVSLMNFVEKKSFDAKDFFLNVLFFVPFGFLFRLLIEKQTNRYYVSFFITVAAGFMLTIMIESLQMLMPARYTSIMDVLSNTIGSVLGALLISISRIRIVFQLYGHKKRAW